MFGPILVDTILVRYRYEYISCRRLSLSVNNLFYGKFLVPVSQNISHSILRFILVNLTFLSRDVPKRRPMMDPRSLLNDPARSGPSSDLASDTLSPSLFPERHASRNRPPTIRSPSSTSRHCVPQRLPWKSRRRPGLYKLGDNIGSGCLDPCRFGRGGPGLAQWPSGNSRTPAMQPP